MIRNQALVIRRQGGRGRKGVVPWGTGKQRRSNLGKDDEFREVEGAEDSRGGGGDVYHQRGMWAGHWGLGGDRM